MIFEVFVRAKNLRFLCLGRFLDVWSSEALPGENIYRTFAYQNMARLTHLQLRDVTREIADDGRLWLPTLRRVRLTGWAPSPGDSARVSLAELLSATERVQHLEELTIENIALEPDVESSWRIVNPGTMHQSTIQELTLNGVELGVTPSSLALLLPGLRVLRLIGKKHFRHFHLPGEESSQLPNNSGSLSLHELVVSHMCQCHPPTQLPRHWKIDVVFYTMAISRLKIDLDICDTTKLVGLRLRFTHEAPVAWREIVQQAPNATWVELEKYKGKEFAAVLDGLVRTSNLCVAST